MVHGSVGKEMHIIGGKHKIWKITIFTVFCLFPALIRGNETLELELPITEAAGTSYVVLSLNFKTFSCNLFSFDQNQFLSDGTEVDLIDVEDNTKVGR